ncbi:hypothetical protein TB2_024927 [Malus domestica]
MKPTVSMTLADLARGVGVIMAHMINTTHIMNPKAYRDWSWIVHPNRNLPEGLVEVTRKYHENVIGKRVIDYNENKKKIDKVDITANEEPSESMGKIGMTIIVFRTEGKVTRKREREKMVDLL